ncbi:MAG: Flp pilus assembly protein CpaB [Raoultibacter sp.]
MEKNTQPPKSNTAASKPTTRGTRSASSSSTPKAATTTKQEPVATTPKTTAPKKTTKTAPTAESKGTFGTRSTNTKKPASKSARDAKAANPADKRGRTLVVISAFSTFIAIAAIAWTISTSIAPDTDEDTKSIEVLVANENIDGGAELKESLFTTMSVPEEFVPAGTVTDTAMLQGAKAAVAIPANGQLRESDISSPSSQKTLAAAITPGMEAVTIAVDNESGMDSLLRQGNLVDVVSYHTDEFGDKAPYFVASGLKIGALGCSVSGVPTDGMYATVTIETTPETTLAIHAAQVDGSVRFVLRAAGTEA